jgi:hypothetical protein
MYEDERRHLEQIPKLLDAIAIFVLGEFVTGMSGSSPDMGQRCKLNPWNGLGEINSLAANDLRREHSKKCEGHKGIQKGWVWTVQKSTVKRDGVYSLICCSEIRDFFAT